MITRFKDGTTTKAKWYWMPKANRHVRVIWYKHKAWALIEDAAKALDTKTAIVRLAKTMIQQNGSEHVLRASILEPGRNKRPAWFATGKALVGFLGRSRNPVGLALAEDLVDLARKVEKDNRLHEDITEPEPERVELVTAESIKDTLPSVPAIPAGMTFTEYVDDLTGKSLRAGMKDDGYLWFVLIDVLKACETSTTTTQAVAWIKRVFGDWYVGNIPIPDAMGRMRDTIVIRENAVTYVIAQSKTEVGDRLNFYIHSEVLPSIRQGKMHYITPDQLTPEFAVELSTRWLEEKRRSEALALENKRLDSSYKKLETMNTVLVNSKAEDAKKLEAFVAVDTDGFSVLRLATVLRSKGFRTGRNMLYAWLAENGYIYKTGRQNDTVYYQPYACYTEGRPGGALFRLVTGSTYASYKKNPWGGYVRDEDGNKVVSRVKERQMIHITRKGVMHIMPKLIEDTYEGPITPETVMEEILREAENIRGDQVED